MKELTCDGDAPVSEPYGHGDGSDGAESPRAAALAVVESDEVISIAQERDTSAVAFVPRPDGTAHMRFGLVALADDTWHVESSKFATQTTFHRSPSVTAHRQIQLPDQRQERAVAEESPGPRS